MRLPVDGGGRQSSFRRVRKMTTRNAHLRDIYVTEYDGRERHEHLMRTLMRPAKRG